MTPTSSNDEPNNIASSDDTVFDDEIVLPDDIVALLGDEATWEPVSDEMENSIIAAVMAEVEATDTTSAPGTPAATTPAATVEAGASAPAAIPDNVVAMPSRWKTAALGAAAALLVVAGLFGSARLGAESPDFEVAMAGTDLAPQASADAEITETPAGTRIVINVAGLPPAAPGTYYQAWLRKDAEVGVSAGTFHLRQGNDPIELWAGVTTDDYPLLTVTLQQEAQTESSGQVVLKALIGDS